VQGGYGSFHEIAARKYFFNEKIGLVDCHTFEELFEAISKKEADCAVMAIENSVAGSLLSNYALVKNSGMNISGEVYLKIVQNLIALPGQCMKDIKVIYSHPMAILQCRKFLDPLREKGVEIVETIDTALSAKYIRDKKVRGAAALASEVAAGMYQLEVIAESVESNSRNYTRFLVVEPADAAEKNINSDKASICFSLPHKVGSLSQVLSVLAYYGINLTKIQSLPIVGKEWEYFFYLDLLFEDYSMYKKALSAISPLIDQLQVLGEYISGKMPADMPE